MKRIVFVLLVLLLPLAACGESPKQLFETAEFEMLQRNYPHARQLYEEILQKHPDSEYAPTARQRLEQLDSQ